MGSYKIDLKHEQKTMDVLVEGMFTSENALAFITDYNKNISCINTTEFALVFDGTNLKITTQEVLPLLENCFQLYKQAGFRKIVMKMGSSVIVKNQARRVIDKVGLLNCEII